jgi:hypothetical protein
MWTKEGIKEWWTELMCSWNQHVFMTATDYSASHQSIFRNWSTCVHCGHGVPFGSKSKVDMTPQYHHFLEVQMAIEKDEGR